MRKMRKMKKTLLIISIILTVLYVPSMAFATNTSDEIIIEEAMNYLNLINRNNEESISTRAVGQTTETFTYWRSKAIYVTRTSGSSGVTATVLNNGSHYVDICIFDANTDEIIGSTKTAAPGVQTLMSWENSSMYDGGKTSEIYVFLTMYATHWNSLTITISY